MLSMKNSCESSASVTALARGCRASGPRLHGGFLRSGTIGRTPSFGAGDCLATVILQTLISLLAGNVFDVSTSALNGRIICCISSAVRGVDAFDMWLD